jgi:hypothetical protein
MPSTRLLASTIGPPLLPELIAASVCRTRPRRAVAHAVWVPGEDAFGERRVEVVSAEVVERVLAERRERAERAHRGGVVNARAGTRRGAWTTRPHFRQGEI